MLNKTKDTAIVSDTDAYVFYEKYNENDLLSKYIHRENIDKLKKQLGSAAGKNGIFLSGIVI